MGKAKQGKIYRFNRFEFTDIAGLSSNGTLIELRPKPSKLLQLLLKAENAIVDRTVIALTLYPGEDPSDAAIDRCAYLLRKALGDHGGELIRSVYGRGFQLVPKISIDDQDEPYVTRYCELDSIVNMATNASNEYFEGDLERAFELAKTIILTNPSSPVALAAYGDLAIARLQRGHMPVVDAKRALTLSAKVALELVPNFPPAIAQRGWMLAVTGRNSARGLELLDRALAADPDNGIVRSYKAWAYVARGDLDSAVDCSFGLTATSSMRRENLMFGAWCLLCKGDLEETNKNLEKFLADDPDYDFALGISAVHQCIIGARAKALAAAERAVHASHEDGSALSVLGYVLAANGEIKRAEMIYERIITEPGRSAPDLLCGALLLGIGREMEAVQIFARTKKEIHPWAHFLPFEPRIRAHRWRDGSAEALFRTVAHGAHYQSTYTDGPKLTKNILHN